MHKKASSRARIFGIDFLSLLWYNTLELKKGSKKK